MPTPRTPAPDGLSPAQRTQHDDDEALVDFESEQSFPASDPPSWTLGPDKDE